MPIAVGSTVILKSGGPLMTVVEIIGNQAVCNWFDDNNVKTGTFPLAVLDIQD